MTNPFKTVMLIAVSIRQAKYRRKVWTIRNHPPNPKKIRSQGVVLNPSGDKSQGPPPPGIQQP